MDRFSIDITPLSLTLLAKKMGVQRAPLKRWLNENGIPIVTIGKTEVVSPIDMVSVLSPEPPRQSQRIEQRPTRTASRARRI